MALIAYCFQFGSALGLNWSAMSLTVLAKIRYLKTPISRGETNSATENWFYSIVCHPLITPMLQLEKQ